MKFSFPRLIRYFYAILLILILALIAFTAIESFQSKYEKSELKSHQRSYKQISELSRILESRYQKLLKQLEREVELSLPQIQKLQQENLETNKRLNQKYLHQSEYLEWQKSDFSNYDSPLLILSFQQSEVSLGKTLTRLRKCASRKDVEDNECLHFPISAPSYPEVTRISDLNLNFIGDFDNRSIYLSHEDAQKFREIDLALNKKLSQKIIDTTPIVIRLDQLTWGIPNTAAELEQAWPKSIQSSRVGTSTIKQLIPMMVIVGYVFSLQSFFGPIPHPYIDMAKPFLQKEITNSESIMKINLNQWEFLASASSQPEKGFSVQIMPHKVTLLKYDKRWLMRSIAAQTIEDLKIDDILLEFKEYKSQSSFLQLDENGKARFSKELSPLNQSFNGRHRDWKLASTQVWNDEKNNYTSMVLQLGGPVLISRWEPREFGTDSIKTSQLILIIAVSFLILLILSISYSDWKIVTRGIQNCLDLILYRETHYNLEGNNELNVLARTIQIFHHRIEWRQQSVKLKRRILHITNLPRLLPSQYLKEFEYACRDLSERFKFSLKFENLEDKTDITVWIGSHWKQALNNDSDVLGFRFQGPLEEMEIHHLQHDLQVLLDRSEIQSQMIHSDKLVADLELSKTLQKVLDPVNHISIDMPDKIEVNPILIRSNQMLFDAMDRNKVADKVNLYHIDMSTRGLSSALLASSFKSSLHSLLQLGMEPAQCLREFNEMILVQNIEDLWISCAILQIDQSKNTINFASAGHSGLWHINNLEYVNLFSKNIPLGITPDYHFESYIQNNASGIYGFFSNPVHLAKQLPPSKLYSEYNTLEEIIAQTKTYLNQDELDYDYCGWLVRIP